MTPLLREELAEVFLFAYREEMAKSGDPRASLDAALNAHANAAILAASGLSSKARRPPTVIALPAIREACEMFGLTPKGMMCESRETLFLDCRAVAALAMRAQGFKPRQIASALGRSDRTTALAAIRRATNRPDLKQKSEEIAAKLAGSPVLRDKRLEAA